MSETASHWDLVRPTRDDIHDVLALMRAFDAAVSGEPDTDLDDIQHSWRSLELDRDAWLAKSAQGNLLAYTALLRHQTDGLRVDIYTQPDLIESAVPGEMLKICLQRAGELATGKAAGQVQRLVAYILHSNHPFRDLFNNAGFEPVRFIYQMREVMSGLPQEPQWPTGIQTRRFVPEKDVYATYKLIQETFDRPGRVRSSLEDWKRHMLRPGSYRPDLWTLAFAGEELVGACLGFDYPDEGWVRQLAVSEEWRGRGLGAALLRNAFSVFYTQGKHRVGLTTESDNPNALAFYERAGMTIRRQYDEYVKPFTPSAESQNM